MPSVLESVEWGKPALTLLSQCKQLNPNLPAVMHIRHTERPKSTQESYDLARKTGISTLLSTKKGKQAAFDFGEHLPSNRVYRVYHSPIERARETAEKIHEGLLSQGAESHLKGIFMRVNNNQVKRRDYLQRYVLDVGAPNARHYFINLVSEHFPPWEIESASLIAKRHASIMMENLKSATLGNFDIYVSHDTVCASFLFYWFGIIPDERWIQFLDGFIMQLTGEQLHVYTKDGRKEAYYPYWWNF
jgi:broad specificity phosphatase PhoE